MVVPGHSGKVRMVVPDQSGGAIRAWQSENVGTVPVQSGKVRMVVQNDGARPEYQSEHVSARVGVVVPYQSAKVRMVMPGQSTRVSMVMPE